MHYKALYQMIIDHDVKFIDLRFTDTLSKEHHLTLPSHIFNEDLVQNGIPFDGSSISGWQPIESSDMLLKPDLATVKLDPFYEHATIFLSCDVLDPSTEENYLKCPRSLAKKAELYLKSSGIADTAYFGPEAEFFVFDSVRFDNSLKGCFYEIDCEEGAFSSKKNIDGGNIGHRPMLKGGYVPLPPVDSLHDLRSDIVMVLDNLGIPTELHHHEVATAGQCEVGTRFSTLVERADWSQIFKYVVKNIAHKYGKTATFMPKPIVGDNGSGMHVHQSLFKNGINLFVGNEYAGLSLDALYYIGGIIKHAKALNAITNPTTNSYKRLVPGFEAPVILTYSMRNRSAGIRIPYTKNDKSKRVEVRFPDPLANPYLAFSAMLMAGLDGIQNKILPKEAMEVNLYELSESKLAKIPQVCSSLEMALDYLDKDRDFLKKGGVFNDKLIDSYINLKMTEVNYYRMSTHPIEYEMYYSI
jgi:glutamine synthetase type I